MASQSQTNSFTKNKVAWSIRAWEWESFVGYHFLTYDSDDMFWNLVDIFSPTHRDFGVLANPCHRVQDVLHPKLANAQSKLEAQLQIANMNRRMKICKAYTHRIGLRLPTALRSMCWSKAVWLNFYVVEYQYKVSYRQHVGKAINQRCHYHSSLYRFCKVLGIHVRMYYGRQHCFINCWQDLVSESEREQAGLTNM